MVNEPAKTTIQPLVDRLSCVSDCLRCLFECVYNPSGPSTVCSHADPYPEPESFVQDAEAYLAEGRVSSAVDSYIAAIKAEPQNINNYLSLATLQIYTGDYEAARVNAENAILLDKSLPQAFILLGWAKGLQQDYLNAEADITTALDMDPNNALGHAVYAYVLAQRVADDVGELDTLDTAIEESKLALRLSPNLMEAHWARGYVLEITANYDEAVEELTAAIEINDNIAELHLALGRNYVAIGENDLAVLNLLQLMHSIPLIRSRTGTFHGFMVRSVNTPRRSSMRNRP